MSLNLGERIVVRADDGFLAAEYALFDATDIVLRAGDPVTIREVGYRTTAGEALDRLARSGVTPAVAEAAARSLSQEVAASFARGTAARAVIPQLWAQELFDGAVFLSRLSRYDGAWLDLGTLSLQLGVPGASVLLQTLHLAAVLAEVPATTPVLLSTVSLTHGRRPGERTYARVDLNGVLQLPHALGKLSPRHADREAAPVYDRRVRHALVARIRERLDATTVPRVRAHLAALDEALTPRTMDLAPIADPALKDIERRLATGDASGIDRELDELERSGRSATAIRYLRERAGLLRTSVLPDRAPTTERIGAPPPIVNPGVRALDEARSLVDTGDLARAREAARSLAEDAAAADDDRLAAIDLLDELKMRERQASTWASPSTATNGRAEANGHADWAFEGAVPNGYVPPVPTHAPPAMPSYVPPLEAATSAAPRGVPVDAVFEDDPSGARAGLPPEARARPPMLPPGRSWAPAPAGAEARSGPPSMPPQPPPREPPATHPPPGRFDAPAARYRAELVEELSLPGGVDESVLGPDEAPRTLLQARVAMTRLAREVGRDYRLWYGKTLRCNVLAVDAMQQHMADHFNRSSLSDGTAVRELLRHGALLSEILARTLGGAWVDIGPSEAGYWAMMIPPGIRTWPIGRVFRFVALGHHGKDLVGYFLDLDEKARSAGR